MANYLKSELYRVTRCGLVYVVIGACMLMMVAMNLILWIFANFVEPGFPYGTCEFSFRMLYMGMAVAMFLALVLCTVVFGDEFKHRTMSNNIAFGLSRLQVFVGKWIVTCLVSIVGLVLVEATLVISGYLLLPHDGNAALMDILLADKACLPLFMAATTIYLTFVFWLKNELYGMWAWLGLTLGGNTIVALLGMKIDLFAKLSNWMYYELVNAYTFDEAGELMMIWARPEGMLRCILAGCIWTALAWIAAVVITRRKE